jgi:phosphoglycerate dehydrogenase-like enzyme
VHRPRCVIAPVPEAHPTLAQAVRDGGGEVIEAQDADAVIWTAPTDGDALTAFLAEHPHLSWVSLPFAGIEPFRHLLDTDRIWTCGKGVYAGPVAEHALMMALAGLRGGVRYARRATWSEPYGHNLDDAAVSILGGGAITERLVELLQPFTPAITVMRNRPSPMPGVDTVVGPDRLLDVLASADVVFLALALTPATRGLIDARALEAMRPHAWLVNVARGAHVDHDALVRALKSGAIGGAALDVTDPEPLPDGHPLWQLDNVLITPHVGNTPEMARDLLDARVRENVRRFRAGEELLGLIDIELGY